MRTRAARRRAARRRAARAGGAAAGGAAAGGAAAGGAAAGGAADGALERRVGFVALQAYGVDSPTSQFPCAVPWRTMHACQLERLVVRPAWRGSGALEALLGACMPYVQRGYPVRVKTGSERAHLAFMRCPLLAYEGHRAAGATACGVRRPMKRYARVLASDASSGKAVGPSLVGPLGGDPTIGVVQGWHGAGPAASSRQGHKGAKGKRRRGGGPGPPG